MQAISGGNKFQTACSSVQPRRLSQVPATVALSREALAPGWRSSEGNPQSSLPEIEDERTLATATHPSTLLDYWSKEDEEVLKEDHPPAAAAENGHEPPPQDLKEEVTSQLKSLQLEERVKEKESVANEVVEELDEAEDKKRHLNVVFIAHANVKVLAIFCNENKVERTGPSENIRVRLSGVEEEDILAGFVLSSVTNPVGAVSEFKAIVRIHAIVEECEIVEQIEEINTKKKKETDPKKRRPKQMPPFVKNGAVVVCCIQVKNLICIENFSDFAQLGRFTLRTEGKTVAVGKVVELPSARNATSV